MLIILNFCMETDVEEKEEQTSMLNECGEACLNLDKVCIWSSKLSGGVSSVEKSLK